MHKEPAASLGPPDSQALVPGIGCTLEHGYVEALHSALQILVAVSAGGRGGGAGGGAHPAVGPISAFPVEAEEVLCRRRGAPLHTVPAQRLRNRTTTPTCVAWATHSAKWAENQFQPQGWREDEPRGQNLKLLMMQWGRAGR